MTVERGQATLSPDPLASQRTELIGQLVLGQFAIEAALTELIATGGDAAVSGQLRGQLAALSDLRQQIGSASGTTLAALRSEVTAAAGNASAVVQQARAAAASAAATMAADVAEIARSTRDQVNATMLGMRDFDPYLRFGSKEEEEAYRRREAAREAYIRAEQAKETPKSDLNAANAAIAQMDDAKSHGADRHPDFADRYASLTQSRDQLRDAIAPATEQPREPKAASKAKAKAEDSNLDAAMAAFREAGIQTAAPTEEIAATQTRAKTDLANRSTAASVRA